MANAKKCDRCGHYYDDPPRNRIMMPYSHNDPNEIRYVSLISIYDRVEGRERRIDLCEKCLKAFNSYLNTPSKYMRDIDD